MKPNSSANFLQNLYRANDHILSMQDRQRDEQATLDAEAESLGYDSRPHFAHASALGSLESNLLSFLRSHFSRHTNTCIKTQHVSLPKQTQERTRRHARDDRADAPLHICNIFSQFKQFDKLLECLMELPTQSP